MLSQIQLYRRFFSADFVQPARTQLLIPAFTLAVPTWNGASDLLAEYALSNTNIFSIRKPVVAFGSNFVAAVRWTSADGEAYFRYVFWVDDSAVLYFPVYNGEAIGANAVIEIWSVNSAEAPALASAATLESSELVFPETCGYCCHQPGESITLVQTGPITLPPGVCNPFCDVVVVELGACTVGVDCSLMSEADCATAGGVYAGNGTTCPTPILPPPNQPAWPIPDPWVGAAFYTPIHAPGASNPTYFVGVNPGGGDPTAYTDAISPDATAAWVAETWNLFIVDVPAYTAARIVWNFVNLSGTNYTGFSVFPSMFAPDYTTSISLTYAPAVEYTV